MENFPPISIDLGTNYCRMGIWRDSKIEIILNDINERKITSYMSFTDSEILFGETSKNKMN